MDVLTGTILPFLVLLTILVFVHELGHYYVARRCGVRVQAFSIGFGPELIGWHDRAGTRWKISAIPLGGYVKMFGDSDATSSRADNSTSMTPEEVAVSFHHKSLRQRSAIVAAGPIANFIFAIFLLAVLYAFVGTPTYHTDSQVGEVIEGSAADAAGLQQGDLIRAIDRQSVSSFQDLRDIVSVNPGIELTVTVERDGLQIRLPVTPKPFVTESGTEIGQIGIRPPVTYETRGLFESAWLGVESTYRLTEQTLLFLGRIIVGKESSDNIGGPIGIAMVSGEMAKRGVGDYIFFAALLSINLGLINLFPVPMLDGEHLAFYAAEAIRGRPLGERAQEYGFRFGLVLILLLFGFATWNDVGRIF